MKMDRFSKEYIFAEKIILLQEALETANKLLNEDGKLGVLPNIGVVSRSYATQHHAKVRKFLKTNL